MQRDGTVMFTDLRGFTSFAEQLPPDRVIYVLNVYLSGMSDTILNHGGTLVAYMGDGIMADDPEARSDYGAVARLVDARVKRQTHIASFALLAAAGLAVLLVFGLK